MSEYSEALREAWEHTDLLLKQASDRTGIHVVHIQRILTGHIDRPREYNANAITRMMLEELGAEIRRKRKEIEEIRRLGEALKAAHAATYGKKERSA